MFRTIAAGAFLALALSASAADRLDPKLVAKGKTLYIANCIACHNRDPNKKGSLGPELVGTSIEVMRMKVATGTQYPQGYVPKRRTKLMRKLPNLEKDIPALHAWVSSMKKSK